MKNILKFLMVLAILSIYVPISLAQNQTQDEQKATITVGKEIDKTSKEEKFRVGPTVKIRPINDVINKSADGIVELYFDNPSLNDVSLTVDAHINVPSGIHVYGQGFGEAGAAGTVYGKFEVPPGAVRTIYVNIKSEKTGNFFAQFSGLYWPGNNKDAYQPMSLSHPFTVTEPSPNPKSAELTNPSQVQAGTGSLMDKIIPGVIIAAIAGLIGLIYKIYEIKYTQKLNRENKK